MTMIHLLAITIPHMAYVASLVFDVILGSDGAVEGFLTIPAMWGLRGDTEDNDT